MNTKKQYIAGAVIVAGLFFIAYWLWPRPVEAPQVLAPLDDIELMVQEIGAERILPENEVPVVAKLQGDISQIRASKPFYKDAEIGDVVLLYPKNNLMVLYRQSTKRIVASGPVE